MASLPNTRTVTYEEWLRMPEVGANEEVVNGEIRIMPAPSWKHSRIINKLSRMMDRQLDERLVEVASSKFNLIIRRQPLTAREPDLAVFHLGTVIEQDGRIHSAPQLIVEVRSPANTTREREEKLADYASLGVPEMWEVVAEDRSVEVRYLEDGKLRLHLIRADGILIPKYFPNVQIRISDIWPD